MAAHMISVACMLHAWTVRCFYPRDYQLCMYIYIYIYIYIHVPLYTHTHTHTNTHKHTHTRTFTDTDTACSYTERNFVTTDCIYTYTHTYIIICIYIYIYIYIHTYTYTYTNTHTHTRMHAHTFTGMDIACFYRERNLVKEALEVFERIANSHNHSACARACFHAGRILVAPGPFTDIKKGIKYLSAASKKEYPGAGKLLQQVHVNTKDGEFLGPIDPSLVKGLPEIGFIKTLRRRLDYTRYQVSGDEARGAQDSDLASAPGPHGMPPTLYEEVSNMMFHRQEKAAGTEVPQPSSAPVFRYDDDLKVMSEYVKKNPTSVEGHRMLLGAMHFSKFLALWEQDRNASLTNLFCAYCFHDRAVKLACTTDANGNRKPEGVYERVYNYVQAIHKNTVHPARFEALLVKALLDITIYLHYDQPGKLILKAIRISESSQATHQQKAVRPVLYSRLGYCMSKSEDTLSAMKSYETCLKLLRDNTTLSLFPYTVPDLPLHLVREQHMLDIDAMIGMHMQYLDQRTTQCVPRLRRYIDGTQHDAYRYYHTHYDLAEALLLTDIAEKDSAKAGRKVVDPAKTLTDVIIQVDEVIKRAEKYKHCHIPVLPTPTEAGYPKISEVKGILNMMKLGCSPHEAVMSAFSSVQESDMTINTKPALKCWGCENEAHLTCTGCRTAKFCSVECARRAWKEHKKDCRTLGGGRKKT
jgi:hypothetical protein